MPVSDVSCLLTPVDTPAQIQKVADLAKIIWTEHYTPLIGSEQVAYMIETFQSVHAITDSIQQGYQYYIIQYENIFAGYTAIFPEEIEKTLFLSKIYVEKSYRGRHLTTKAITQMKEVCKKKGLNKIRLNVNKKNQSSIVVYEHLGFIKVRETVIEIGQGYVMDDYIMELII